MLFIHIGTLKTGSTAIQAFMKANGVALASQGIHYPEAGRRDRNKHFYLRDEIRVTGGVGGQEWAEISALHARHPDGKLLVSEEGFALMKPEGIAAMGRLVSKLPVTVLAYYRDYASWLPSMYAEYTKNGRNLLDFDAYFDQVMALPTQGEVIASWAHVFGWDRLCVRLFSRETLVNSDVVDDVLGVLGTSRSVLQVPFDEPVRAAPGWEALETARALLARIAALPGGAVDGKVPLFVRNACKDATAAMSPSSVSASYLSSEQRRRCDELSRREIEELNRHLSSGKLELPPPKPMGERPFLPGVSHVPAAWVAEAAAQMAVLLAQQVPDGRVERKPKRKKGEEDGESLRTPAFDKAEHKRLKAELRAASNDEGRDRKARKETRMAKKARLEAA